MDDPMISRAAVALLLTGVFVGASALSILLVSPVADAGCDQTVDVGEIVQFDGSGSQNAAQYWWNFRDNGWTNSTVNPTRVYQTEGVYFVGLLVIASNGQQNLDTVKITVKNNPPIADAGQDLTAFEDEIVAFNGNATMDSAIDMPSLSYEWNFGDGHTATGISATHRYARAGSYCALLSVTDDQGAIGRAIRNVTVLNDEPTVTVSDVAANEGTAFTVCAWGDDSVSDWQSLRYEWDNGKFGEETSYRYDRPGEFHPKVTVRDDNNATAVATGNVLVRNVAPITGILGVTAKTDLSVNIALRASGEKWHDLQLYILSNDTLMGNTSVYRIPGNPNAQEVTIPDFPFNLKNQYQIITYYTPEEDPVNGQTQGATPAWITFTFEDGSYETINNNFNVEQQSTWVWEVDPIPHLYGQMIEFEGFAFDPGAYNLTTTWDFGDGTTLTKYHDSGTAPSYASDAITHSFPSIGTYHMSLSGTDKFGENGIFSLTITIDDEGNIQTSNLAPEVTILGSIGTVTENVPACLIATAVDLDSGGELTYQWFFGDGATSSGQLTSDENTAFHSYNYSGSYVVTMVVKDSQNATGIAWTTIRVENAEPVAIILGNETLHENRVVLFNASSSSDTTSDQGWLTYIWNMGDGTILIGMNATHVFRSIGQYDVTLAVIDNDGAVSITTMDIEVLMPAPPKVILSDKTMYGPACALTLFGVGDADSSEVFDLTYYWDFGDDSPTASGSETTHTYVVDGLYQVTLIVTDRYGQASMCNAFVNVVIDSDGDSLTDAQELNEGTDSNNADTDGDTVIDYWEIHVYDTSPIKFDSDDDGANDWYEAIYFGYNVDTDNDTLMNPWDPDSDNDGMLDGNDSRPLIYDAPSGGTYTIIETKTNWADSDSDYMTVVFAIKLYNAPQQISTVNAYAANQLRNEQVAIISIIGNDSTAEQQIAKTCSMDPLQYWVSFHKKLGAKLEFGKGIMPTFDFTLIRNDGNPIGKFDMSVDVTYNPGQITSKGILPEDLALYQYFQSEGFKVIGSSLGQVHRDTVHAELSGDESTRPSYYALFQLGDASRLDSDYDGLSDEQELYHRHGGFFSDPNIADEDLDGLYDGWKDINRNMIWDMGEEYGEQGSYSYGTHPKCPDTDSDGLYDGWHDVNGNGAWDTGETKGEVGDISKNAGGWGTNPKYSDTDNDGLFDGWNEYDMDRQWDHNEPAGEIGDETQSYLGGYQTNPLLRHSDSDNVPDGSDIDPLIDLELTILVSEIFAWDMIDWHASPHGPIAELADFYWDITVVQEPYINSFQEPENKPYISDQDHIKPVETHTWDVDDQLSSRYVNIMITLYDVDGQSLQICDVADEGYYAVLEYDLYYGYWTGADSFYFDQNGHGLVSGNEDGSTDRLNTESDCDLWFDIWLSDIDMDGMTTYEEVTLYHDHANPIFCDSYGDWDSDGMPNGWEVVHGLTPFIDDSMMDLDGDSIPNLWEYELRFRGKNPDNPYDSLGFDLVISFEWDIDNAYRDQFIAGMREASNYLFVASDSYFYIRSIVLYENGDHWDTLDAISVSDKIVLSKYDSDWPHTDLFFWDTRNIHMPRAFNSYGNGESTNIQYPDDPDYYRTVIHEFGHLKLFLLDEYIHQLGGEIDINNRLHSVMANQFWYDTFSTKYDYDNPGNLDANTQQGAFGGGSCWERIYFEYNYFSLWRVSQGHVPRGVQFDFNGDYSIDTTYWGSYTQSTTAFYSPGNNWAFTMGDYLNVFSYLN